MSHLHLSIVQNGHLANLLLHIHPVDTLVLLLNLTDKPAVDLVHNLIYSGKQSGEQVNGPFLQSLRHDGMVGVGAGLRGHFPGLVPCQIIIIQQNAHQLRNRHRGMGIIELESHFLMEAANIVMLPHIFVHSLLNGCRDKEILLL